MASSSSSSSSSSSILPEECQSNWSQDWRTKMVDDLTYRINNPSGVWADFNVLHRGWKVIYTLVVNEQIFCADDIPPEPNPIDYLDDLTSPTTITEDIGWDIIFQTPF